MLAKIFSGTVHGVNGLLVEVEVDIASGLPTFATVGLPEAAVRESKDRVKAAIKNSGYNFPGKRITVNLAPADLPKAGTGFDLPIAMGILACSEIFDSSTLHRYLMIGELSLDGGLRPVNGILPITLSAHKQGFEGIIVPFDNAKEASVVQGIEVIPVANLHQAVDFITGEKEIQSASTDNQDSILSSVVFEVDFSEVKGQEQAKRALEIAAAGNHNILFEGCPGSGKTMLARRLPTILPDLTMAEALETTQVYSVSGLNNTTQGIIQCRPFRAPHHNVSDAGLIGGGQFPKPGEVSLAHNGVLFLDELSEFKKHILEGLRQPLEDGHVTISRAATSMSFPANFLLAAATNPCPCGYHGSVTHECVCLPNQIERYKNRISGPLLDRIDIHIEMPAVPFKDLARTDNAESSAHIKERVVLARAIQSKRFEGRNGIYSNSQMSSKDLQKFCELNPTCQNMLEKAVDKLGLSARAYQRIRKISRTIADLAGCPDIQVEHIAEAVQYRRLDRQ